MEPTTEQLVEMAFRCRSLGLVPIPTNDSKRAVTKWKQYNEIPPSANETRTTFRYSITKGIAILCGPVSGNLEVIVIDTKNDIEGGLAKRYFTIIKENNPGILQKLVIQKTRSGGYHVLYRCETVERSHPLARRPATEAELSRDPLNKVKVLIETRAKRGMACIAPSDGYRFIAGDLTTLSLITNDERKLLLDAATRFNKIVEKRKKRTIHYTPKVNNADRSFSPIDDFNKRGDVISLLVKHGWIIVDDRDPDVTHLLRPGDTDKDSSGNYNKKLNLFSTFSTSTVFTAEEGYSPAGVFIMLECGGDDNAGVKELLRQGYGVSYAQRRKEIQAKR